MKKTILLLSLFVFGFLFSQKTFDKNLVGCWKGSEHDQQVQGVSKYWISCRLEDGRSLLNFIAVYPNKEVTQTTENGKWWTENGKYYELHDYDGVTDIYNYEVLNENEIRFSSIELMGENDDSYVFVDTKIVEKQKK